ncbi:YkuS family protein [Ectobacillus panaciterrae]|uniref:YkuS family protein n=1 Tax=Ectobacillus panaciterrae TaxID=363872 RepID=UPI000406D52D|nr:YkuS family protein [Ectobacillus panaciterrae]
MARIGVEHSLSNVRQALEQKGHEVVQLRSESDVQGCDCCVVTGQDSNVMGMSTISIDGPVVEASGLTAEEICQQVESRLQ